MDAVDNNDFLFMYLVVGKQYFNFTWMLWIIMTSLICFHVFGCLKQDLHFTWMLMDNNDNKRFYMDVVD